MSSKHPYIAIVDLGSNSFNLIIAKNEGVFRPILKRFNITVQLAKYLGDDKILSQAGINRCVESLQAIQQFIEPLMGQIEVRANATYTIRSTKNIEELLSAIHKVFPHKINIISGEQEALNIYRGICLSNPIYEKFLALDIGGGSTEIIFSENLEPQYYTSQNIGCVSWSHKYFADGILDHERFNQAVEHAMEILAPVRKKALELDFLNPKIAVGSSGTVKNSLLLVKTYFREVEKSYTTVLSNHKDGKELLDPTTYQKIVDHLHAISSFRAKNPELNHLDPTGLQMIEDLVFSWQNTNDLICFGYDASGREVLAGGLAVLKAIFKTFGITHLIYSDTALREGVLYQELTPQQIRNLRYTTLESLKEKYAIDPYLLEEFTRHTYALSTVNKLNYSKEQIETFCLFNLLGLYIDDDNYAAHSLYIFRNSKLYGFTQEELSRLGRILTLYSSATQRTAGKISELVLYMTLAYFFISSDFDKLVSSGEVKVLYRNRTSLDIFCNQETYDKHIYLRDTLTRMGKKVNKASFCVNLNITDLA